MMTLLNDLTLELKIVYCLKRLNWLHPGGNPGGIGNPGGNTGGGTPGGKTHGSWQIFWALQNNGGAHWLLVQAVNIK